MVLRCHKGFVLLLVFATDQNSRATRCIKAQPKIAFPFHDLVCSLLPVIVDQPLLVAEPVL